MRFRIYPKRSFRKIMIKPKKRNSILFSRIALKRLLVFFTSLNAIAGLTFGYSGVAMAGFFSIDYPAAKAGYVWQSVERGEVGGFNDPKFYSGYQFSPKRDGYATELCGYFDGTRPVNLYDGSFNILATVPVASSKQWNCVPINPVKVLTNQDYYVVGEMLGQTAYYQYECCKPNLLPKVGNETEVKNGVTQNLSSPFGTSVKRYPYAVFGLVDVKISFEDLSKQAAKVFSPQNVNAGQINLANGSAFIQNCSKGQCVTCIDGQCTFSGAGIPEFSQKCENGECVVCLNSKCLTQKSWAAENDRFTQECKNGKCVSCTNGKCITTDGSGSPASGGSGKQLGNSFSQTCTGGKCVTCNGSRCQESAAPNSIGVNSWNRNCTNGKCITCLNGDCSLIGDGAARTFKFHGGCGGGCSSGGCGGGGCGGRGGCGGGCGGNGGCGGGCSSGGCGGGGCGGRGGCGGNGDCGGGSCDDDDCGGGGCGGGCDDDDDCDGGCGDDDNDDDDSADDNDDNDDSANDDNDAVDDDNDDSTDDDDSSDDDSVDDDNDSANDDSVDDDNDDNDDNDSDDDDNDDNDDSGGTILSGTLDGQQFTIVCSNTECILCINGDCTTISLNGGGSDDDDDSGDNDDNDDIGNDDDNDDDSANDDSVDDDNDDLTDDDSVDDDNDSANDDSADDDNDDNDDNDSDDDDNDDSGGDTTPPEISSAEVMPGSDVSGSIFTITVEVTDDSDIDSVKAYLQNPDDNDVATVKLYDDGDHGDGDASDGVYGNEWDSSGVDEGDYYVDIRATDSEGNFSEEDNAATFTIESDDGDDDNDDSADDNDDNDDSANDDNDAVDDDNDDSTDDDDSSDDDSVDDDNDDTGSDDSDDAGGDNSADSGPNIIDGGATVSSAGNEQVVSFWVKTENDAACRSYYEDNTFENLKGFCSTGGTTHSCSASWEGQEYIYVRCQDDTGINTKSVRIDIKNNRLLY